MLSRGGLCLLVVACAGAYQTYDEDHSDYIDGDTTYNDDNYNDFGGDTIAPGGYGDPLQDLALLRTFRAFRKRSNDELKLRKSLLSQVPKSPKKESHLPEPRLEDIKITPVTPKPSRWRIRRKPGLCLLKLCTPYYMQW